MGNYNPHTPYILGQEWVPIRDAAYLPDEITERGYQWVNGHTVVPVSGCFYINQVPQNRAFASTDLIAVYPAGAEDQTGPIKVLNIPVSAVLATGAGAGNINVSAGFTALNNPSDGNSITLGVVTAGSPGILMINFDAASYAQQLLGKRILDVSFRYALNVDPANARDLDLYLGFAKNLDTNTASGTGGPLWYSDGLEAIPVGQKTVIKKVSFQDINRIWDATAKPLAQHDARPWRYQELARFAATEPFASRYMVMIVDNITTATLGGFLQFADLQITYCEEQRVKYGASVLHDSQGAASENNSFYNVGPQLVQLVGTDFLNTGSLAPGSYVTTITHRDTAFLGASAGLTGQPLLAALRELYQLPPQQGKIINQSLIPDATFTVTGSAVLPEITLHHSGGVVTGSHAYGFQDEIPVYGSITAIQEIEDDPVGASAQFPQVRFYARRFADTTVALRLIDVATGTFTTSISVAAFDALPTIVDGWKEVTLRFASPPSFATAAGNVDWRWDAVGETAGNQWQVLGAGSVDPASSIAPANYYAPVGNTTTLTWQSPTISGTSADQMSDAVLIFSQDPPTVTGFAINTSTQTVTGVSLNCGVPKSCIPTGIYCNNVTWSAQTALPVTGFGYYELQRSDTVDATFQTIMKATSTAVTGFCDYEARVGIASSYRLRMCNVLDFCGAWVTGTATLPAPGVTSPNTSTANGVLIFTSNKQPGSNLAYRMQFEDQPVETFVFPEADLVQLQQMFGKDFATAFHPLERGGERFGRILLVSAAAIPLKSLANFNNLRDLAWAALPYVCVRDELGNRWYAAVRVPSGRVRGNRRLYFAQIEVAETTATPYPVNP